MWKGKLIQNLDIYEFWSNLWYQVPVEVCAPAGCKFREGEDICYEKSVTIIHDSPEESCNIDPRRSCKHVTKLVPFLHVRFSFDIWDNPLICFS